MNALIDLCASTLRQPATRGTVSFVKKPFTGFSDTNDDFCHPKLREVINKSMNTEFFENVFLGEKNVKISFICGKGGKDVPQYRLQFIFFYVKYILNLMHAIRPIPTDAALYIIDLPHKKRMPRGYLKALNQYNVNSGRTAKYPHFAEVHVYRREEMFKVLVHELIHFFEVDHKMFSHAQEHNLATYFGVENVSMRINECFTDTMACLLNVIIYSMFQGALLKDGSLDKFATLLKQNLKGEAIHIMQQAAKVLRHGGYVFNKRGITQKLAHTEHTHVISYYVLKACMFLHMDQFLEFLGANKLRLANPDGFVALLEKNIFNTSNTSEFWPALLAIDKKMPSHDTGLRMSVIDIADILFFQKAKLLKTLHTV